MSTRQFGEKVQRREDPRLLTGNGRYLDDLGHTALAAAFVRSPHAHARVVDIDIDDAWEVDEIVGGNLCRCTGYANIKKAVRHAAATMKDAE